jgi:hypothetical protein
MTAALADTVTLQQGRDGYKGCASATLWKPKTRKPKKQVTDEVLYLRGANNHLLLRFDMPAELRRKTLARARLEVFVPSARRVRMINETACRQVLEPWSAKATWQNARPGDAWKQAGGTAEDKTDYRRGRPAGVLDSYSVWEYSGQWFPHKFEFLKVPKGGKWIDFNITPAVRKWLKNPDANHGVVLHGIHQRDRRFPNRMEVDIPSPSNPRAERRPRLILEFEPVEKPYLVGMTHTLRKYCDQSTRHRFWGPFDESYDMAMARNEYEGFQVLVYPLTKKLKGVRFECSDLVDPKTKARIPAEDIRYNAQEMLKLYPNPKVKDWYFHGKNFVMPDPLVWDKPKDLPLHMSTPF